MIKYNLFADFASLVASLLLLLHSSKHYAAHLYCNLSVC